MDIRLKETDHKGLAVAAVHGEKAGEMTYSIADKNFIIIDHTEVEPDYRGKDVGKQLLFKIVEMAREKNLKIRPLCPFANAMFKKLSDLQDVLKK